MKSSLLILTWLTLLFNEQYIFDYRLVYEYTSKEGYSPMTRHFYVNSKNNHFHAVINNTEKDTMEFYFRDEDKMTIMLGLNGNYKNPGTISIADSLTRRWSNKNIQVKNYDFQLITDTIIADKKYTRVKLSSVNPKREKRKKLGYEIYIVDTTVNKKPFFYNPLPFQIWRKRKNFPDGLIVEKHLYSYNGKLSSSEVLKEMAAVDFKIIIQK